MSRILLLEPDKELGNTYQTVLEFLGHEVAHCHDAQMAIHHVDKQLPDIIITELHLAMHSGVEFLYELRSYTEWQNIPVIVLSSLPAVERETLRALWQQLKISAYHYKPLTKLHELVRSVDELAVVTVS